MMEEIRVELRGEITRLPGKVIDRILAQHQAAEGL